MSEKAKRFAIEAHGNQQYDGKPYEFHLNEVVDLVAQVRDPTLHPSFLEDVAWLHDVLEDTVVGIYEITVKINPFVTRSVQIISDQSGSSRASRKAMANSIFRNCSVDNIPERAALIVKTADRLANIKYSSLNGCRDKLKMYRDEHAAFEAAVRRPDLPLTSFWDRMAYELALTKT